MPELSAIEKAASQVELAQQNSGISVPVEERTAVLKGILKSNGVEITNEVKVTIPKGMRDLQPAANLVWTQIGGLGRKIDNTTFEFYPLHAFEKFSLEFKIISGITL